MRMISTTNMDASCSSISSCLSFHDAGKISGERKRYFNIWLEGVVGSLVVDDQKIWFLPRQYQKRPKGNRSAFVSWTWDRIDFVEALHPRNKYSRRLGRLELVLATNSFNGVVGLEMDNDTLCRVADDINDRLADRADAELSEDEDDEQQQQQQQDEENENRC